MSAETPRPTWRRWLLPVNLLLLAALAVVLPSAYDWTVIDPRLKAGMQMVAPIVGLVCVLLVLLWFFTRGSISLRAKVVAVVLLLAVVGAGFASISEVDFDGELRPILHFRWEDRPTDLLREHLANVDDSSDLPPIDLTVNSITDFPRYRGGRADGRVIPLELLATDWDDNPPKKVWRQPCGAGYAGFAVAGNVAITVEQRDEDEAIVCYDRNTGQQRWVHSYPAHFRDPTGDGPRATPTIHAGRVYSLGAKGDLVCVDGWTGKERWHVNVIDDCQAKVVTWGMTSSPLIVPDLGLVIVNPGIDPSNNAEMARAAYRMSDGKRVWAEGEYAAGYSSAQVAVLAGRKQGLLFDAGGLVGFSLKTGKRLWRHPWKTFQDMNITQPLVIDRDRVLVSSEASNGCALIQVVRKGDDLEPQVVWANRNLISKFSNPIAAGEAIYGLSYGNLVCLDQKTGQLRWRGKRYGHGQILHLGAALLVQGEDGRVSLVKTDPKKFQELARFRALKDKTWNTPAVAGRQLFVRNAREMACYELPLKD